MQKNFERLFKRRIKDILRMTQLHICLDDNDIYHFFYEITDTVTKRYAQVEQYGMKAAVFMPDY